MNVSVLVHTKNKSLATIKKAIEVVNQLQPEFSLHFETADWLPNNGKVVDPRSITKVVRDKYPDQRMVAIVRSPLRGDYLDFCTKGLNVVSTDRWDKDFAPPPLLIYIVFQFAYSLASFVALLPSKQLDKLGHRRPRGCIFDPTQGRNEFRFMLVASYMCAKCEATLSEWGVADRETEAIERILAYVRDFVIRRPRALPNAVFIGHGRHGDWKKVRDHLIALNIPYEEFTVSPTAGITTVDRLTQMMDRACFAILVMTAEDKQPDGRKNTRQNVVHEIGLFQGKLGFQKSAILMEKGAAKFSNIDGLTYIPYNKGEIDKSFPEVERVLRRERVIP